MNGSPHPAQADGPITPDLLADLQAGLLDDATAAHLRRRVRAEPETATMLAALDRVRSDLAALGTDERSARPLTPAAAGRLDETLRRLDRPRRLRTTALITGAAAAVLGVGIGTATLVRAPVSTPATATTVADRTARPMPDDIGVPDAQILSLLSEQPDLGAFADPRRRADCLSGLGYPPGITVLGARPIDVTGGKAVLLVLPDDTPGGVVGLVVSADCTSTHPGLLADTALRAP